MLSISSDKNIVVIVLVGIILVLLGVLYYNYASLQERAAKSGVGAPLPEVKDLRLIQGEVTGIAGTILTIKVNKLIGPSFSSGKVVSEERRVVVSDKTEIVKLTFPPATFTSAPAAAPFASTQPKADKISFKHLKKGDFIGTYADKNIVDAKEFTARKIEVLSKN